MALPCRAPPMTSTPFAVVRVNSSMFWRVPGPADADATVATISAYSTAATRLTANNRNRRLTATGHQVEIVGADALADIHRGHHIFADRSGREIDRDGPLAARNCGACFK